MSVALLSAERRWVCPNCDVTDVTHEQGVTSRFHTCGGLRGLSAPMVPYGTKAKVEAKDREDYLGADVGLVQTDGNGRPVMSIVTTRDDGQDCAVLAPMATATKE